MKKLVTILFCVGMFTFAQAQEYQTAAGLRAGVPYGGTIKHFISDEAAFEGIIGSRWSGFTLVGLYEIHQSIGEVEGLYVFYGGGAHFSSYRGYRWAGNYYRNNTTLIGIDGIIGLDYKIPDVPLNFSLDWKPVFHFVEYAAFWPHESALSIRYCF